MTLLLTMECWFSLHQTAQQAGGSRCYRIMQAGVVKSTETGRFVKTHGLSTTITCYSWANMMARCYNEKCHKFPSYGGSGIKVCEFLRESPASIIQLIGAKPSTMLSIDRIDNDGNYSCGGCVDCLANGWVFNVKWSTAKEQSNNRSSNRWFNINGMTFTGAQWCEQLGITRRVFYRFFDGKRYK